MWYKANHFLGITGDCKLPAPINFIRSISAGKVDSFRLDYVSVSEERGSVGEALVFPSPRHGGENEFR